MSFYYYYYSICFWSKWQALAHWLCILNHYCNLLLIPGLFFINSASYISNHGLCEQRQFSLFSCFWFFTSMWCVHMQVCIGVDTCVWVHVHTHAHMEAWCWHPKSASIDFTTHSLSACLEVVVVVGFPVKLSSYLWQLALETHVRTGITGRVPHPHNIYMSSGDASRGPQVYTEQSPQPQFYFSSSIFLPLSSWGVLYQVEIPTWY